MDATTEKLVDFALAAEFSELDAETVRACKCRIVDTIASALGAYDDPLCEKARAIASRYPAQHAATVWGSGLRAAPEAAAFANGVMLRFLDISDTYLGNSGGHPSDVTSGIVAAGEAAGADGKSVINAITLAYDVYCSLMNAIDVGPKGWDQTLYAVLGCVLGAGKLMRLSRDQLGNAVSLALTPNMALRETRQGEISGWKGCAGANAARNALFAATLAQEGFTGPPAPFEGKQGLWNAVGRFEWQLPDRSGTRMVTQTHLKSLPVCYHGQSAVLCALEMRPGLRVADIAEIHVEAYRGSVAMMAADPSRWAPATRETADHSMPYVVVAALLDGDVTVESYAAARLSDPTLASLMKKVKVTESPPLSALYPESAPSRVSVRMRSGETMSHEIRYPKGHVKNPMSEADVERKFRAMFDRHGDAAHCAEALQRLWDFDQARDIGETLAVLAKRRSPSERPEHEKVPAA